MLLPPEREAEPVFTAQDEQQERASLSLPDIVSVQSDVTGITLGVAGLKLQPHPHPQQQQQQPQQPPQHVADQLADLDDALVRLPPSQTAAYRQARNGHPHLVSDERRLQFLECEGGDPAAAARRLAAYWTRRLEVFGPARSFLPMTAGFGGAMTGEEALEMCHRAVEQPLPEPDGAGRAVMYVNPSRRSRRSSVAATADQQLRALFYVLECVAADASFRRRGLVLLIDVRDYGREHFHRRLLKVETDLMFSVFPIRTRAVHLCNPNDVAFYVLAPIIKFFIPRDFRLRVIFHRGGSPEQMLAELACYNLPRDRLPAELGGGVSLNMGRWLADRMRAEQRQAVEQQHKERQEQEAGDAKPASKRPKKEKNEETRGRKSDPRMVRALQAKSANPDVSLFDALVAGGFQFFEEEGMDDLVDLDGVTLAQRKNNLCRRVRREKLKQRPSDRDGAGLSTKGQRRKKKEKRPSMSNSNTAANTVAAVSARSIAQAAAAATGRGKEGDEQGDRKSYISASDMSWEQMRSSHGMGFGSSGRNPVASSDPSLVGLQAGEISSTQSEEFGIGDTTGDDNDSFCDAINELPGIDVDPAIAHDDTEEFL